MHDKHNEVKWLLLLLLSFPYFIFVLSFEDKKALLSKNFIGCHPYGPSVSETLNYSFTPDSYKALTLPTPLIVTIATIHTV